METTAIQKDSKLKEFFVDQLEDLYWAEKKLVKPLPKLSERATRQQLSDAFLNHCEQTNQHVSRLEKIFRIDLGISTPTTGL